MGRTGRVSTVRLSAELRVRLKLVAAARRQTMEASLAEAVELWMTQSVGRPSGRAVEEAKRMREQVEQIAGSGNPRLVSAAMCVLDGLCLQV